MLESFNSGKFDYKRLTEAEQKERGILGRLMGVIADTKNSTRNGRKYSSELWENVFNNDVMKEKIANRCCFGELGHPTEREEVDMEKIAICLAEQPKLSSDGKVYGVFDILSTPNGRILKSLCDYGCNVGVSSRGTGDLYTDDDGNEAVDPETYNCECWDAVLVPAVKEARLKYVTESLEKTRYNKTLRQSLQESLDKASEGDKKVMTEALDTLGIDLDKPEEDVDERLISKLRQSQGLEEGFDPDNYTRAINAINDGIESDEDIEALQDYLQNIVGYCKSIADDYGISIECLDEECNNESCADKEEPEVANDKSEDELVAEFTEALQTITKLKEDNLSLQEQVSVCNAKEQGLIEQLGKYKQATVKLSDTAKKVRPLKEENNNLTESLTKKDKLISHENKRINHLTEAVKAKEKLISQENQRINSLTESLKAKAQLDDKVKDLNESLDKISKQLDESKQLVERYRKSYKALKENYLSAKAQVYGIKFTDLKQNLTESYKLKDVDSICEKLVNKRNKLDKLPFSLRENARISITTNEPVTKQSTNSDDAISSTLLNFIND